MLRKKNRIIIYVLININQQQSSFELCITHLYFVNSLIQIMFSQYSSQNIEKPIVTLGHEREGEMRKNSQ